VATAPEGRLVTVRFLKGSLRAPKANIEKIVSVEGAGWTGGPTLEGGIRRRKYGYRRKSNAAAGQAITIDFADGERWTYRLTGTIENFIDRLIAAGTVDSVTNITTQRGAEYGPDTFTVPD
jgi:hypothetical protein